MSGVAFHSGGPMTVAVNSANVMQDLVRDAIESRTPLRIAGRSHWMDAGRPVAATRIASLAGDSGVVDYVPGDLTITVRGGTTLAEIEKVTAAEGQWLPLDPHGSAGGTIGATIATGSFGPLAHGFGRARDLVLGLTFVTGEGRVVKGGGRVVKNVAGFDLVRLLTGSWGTIGIVTEATLRLYARPQTSLTVAMTVPDGQAALAARLDSILGAPVTPLAVELMDPSVTARLGGPARSSILIELGGNAASVLAQRNCLSRLGGMSELAASPRAQLRALEQADDSAPIVLRVSSLSGRVAEMWTAATRSLRDLSGALMHATPGLGIVRCILPGGTSARVIQSMLDSMPEVTVVYERLPPELWQVLSPGVVSDRLSQGIMRAFDPHRILNPGIMGPVS